MFRYFLLLILLSSTLIGQQKKIIYLSWDDVVDKSLKDNISIQSKLLENEIQDLEVWQSYLNFLPSITYQGVGVHNLELPSIVFMGQKFTMGTNYSYQHAITATLPLFTGGSRYFNIKVQNYLQKSLSEELKGKEEEVVFQTLQAYYGIILANELSTTALDAVEVAESNLKQVQLFYDVGTATQLDLQRALAQYYSTIPQLESAESNRILAYQNLKMLLDIPLEDSVVVIDTLSTKDFLDSFKQTELNEYKNLSLQHRSELKSLGYQIDASNQGENMVLSSFFPTIVLSGNLQYQAFTDENNVQWKDYSRSKAITLSISWPLFEGGKRYINYQIAQIRTEQMKLIQKQSQTQISLEVEQNFYRFNESVKNLQSLEEAMKQSKESLRLSNLLYGEGMSTQIDILNAQLLYNSSRIQYLQGIYNYNINQLKLLKSIGKLNIIWN
ncbi:MAG: TolC family protein [Ignavibacteriales bacterium]|nr:TolC family protein [Ignavibacteriales bacterium]